MCIVRLDEVLFVLKRRIQHRCGKNDLMIQSRAFGSADYHFLKIMAALWIHARAARSSRQATTCVRVTVRNSSGRRMPVNRINRGSGSRRPAGCGYCRNWRTTRSRAGRRPGGETRRRLGGVCWGDLCRKLAVTWHTVFLIKSVIRNKTRSFRSPDNQGVVSALKVVMGHYSRELRSGCPLSPHRRVLGRPQESLTRQVQGSRETGQTADRW
jgi:hypothetical protein